MPTTPLQGQSAQWQEAAARLMERAMYNMWNPKSSDEWWAEGDKAFDYLEGYGLSHDTIAQFHLGYNPTPQQFPFSEWGIDPGQLPATQQAKGGVNIPDGIIVPWYVSGQIQKLTVIRPGKSPDYGMILGSQDCLFNGDAIQPGEPVIMVESELAAMRIFQKTGVTCVATGGEKRARTAQSLASLSTASLILQCFESDEAADYWTECLPNCMRWFPPEHDVKEWAEAGIYSGMVEVGQICPLHTLARVESPAHQQLSKAEIIFRFQQEVSRFFGGCEVYHDVPTLAERVKQIKQESYWT